MAKAKNINSVALGALGDIRIYQRRGQIVVRARHNATVPQNKTICSLNNKSRFMNVVRAWSAFRQTLEDNFELKPDHQTVYNAFMANNLPGARVFLSKRDVAARACLIDNFVVSRGSLQHPVEISERNNLIVSDIFVGPEPITLDTPMNWLASRICHANQGFYQNGDEIVFYRATQRMGQEGSEQAPTPEVSVRCITLPLRSTYYITLGQHLQSIGAEGLIDGLLNADGYLACQPAENSLVAWVHRRPVPGETTKVTTQTLYGTNYYLAAYATGEARSTAVASYDPRPNYSAPTPTPVMNPFEAGPTAPEVSISVENGTGSGTYRIGTKLTITAKPEPGKKFRCWADGNRNPSRTVVAFADITYRPIFDVDPLIPSHLLSPHRTPR